MSPHRGGPQRAGPRLPPARLASILSPDLALSAISLDRPRRSRAAVHLAERSDLDSPWCSPSRWRGFSWCGAALPPPEPPLACSALLGSRAALRAPASIFCRWLWDSAKTALSVLPCLVRSRSLRADALVAVVVVWGAVVFPGGYALPALVAPGDASCRVFLPHYPAGRPVALKSLMTPRGSPHGWGPVTGSLGGRPQSRKSRPATRRAVPRPHSPHPPFDIAYSTRSPARGGRGGCSRGASWRTSSTATHPWGLLVQGALTLVPTG